MATDTADTAEHKSDCALHNEPAFPAGPCDCGPNLTDIEELPDLTHKQFGFVKAILSGMTATDAYKASYNAENMQPETVWAEASRLHSDHKVAAWIARARDQALTSAIMTKEAYIQELWNDRQRLVKSGNDVVALRALELAGKVMGHYVDRSEVDVNVKVERIERVIVDLPPGKPVIDNDET